MLRRKLPNVTSHQQREHELGADMELDHILWPSDPVDPVTLFYNELQMSTYVSLRAILTVLLFI